MSVAMSRSIMPALALEHTPWTPAAAARPLDVWNADDKRKSPMARSMSLHLCTESLGCETGSVDLDQSIITSTCPSAAAPKTKASIVFPPPILDQQQQQEQTAAGELTAVRYHRSRSQRAFPPPLPSLTMSRRNGTCTQMRSHRRDGRLVLEAVPVRPHGYLHAARRQGGRLTLCLVDCSVRHQTQTQTQTETESTMTPTPTATRMGMVLPTENEDKEDDEEEDEVELVDRGTMVEVVAASGKAQRSRIVINKFVGGTPAHHLQASRSCVLADDDEALSPAPGLRRVPSSTRTLAAAVAAASTGMDKDASEETEEEESATMSNKMLFTSRVGDREELVKSVRRCRQLRQTPLFIVEPYCIATSSS